MMCTILFLFLLLALLDATVVVAFLIGPRQPPVAVPRLSSSLLSSSLSSSSSSLSSSLSSSSSLRAVKEASFGMGCFWEPAEEMLKVDGVLDTVSGYTGNKRFDDDITTIVPSYDNVCYGREWVEGVRVTYDDATISYEELLDVFFDTQNPQPQSRQYSSIVFPHDETQYNAAVTWSKHNEEMKRERDSDGFQAIWTSIEYPRTKFYAAEGYHQRYWEKQRPRFGVVLVLLAISVGLLDPLFANNDQMIETIRTVANGSTVVIGLGICLERFLDSKVVVLD